jgi:hypothetical protein
MSAAEIFGWISQYEKALFLAFLIIGPTVAILLKRGAASAGVLAAAGAAALLLTRLPDISTFELLALKVRLENQSRQVEVSIKALQKMASAFAKANLTELAMSDQLLYGTDTRLKFAIHDEIIASLKEIKVPDDNILEEQRVWIAVYCRMILDDIEELAGKLLQTIKVEEGIEQLPKQKGYQLPLPEALRNWAAAKSLKDDKLSQFLDEYQKVWTTGAMNAPDLILPNQVMKNRN